MSDAKPDVRRIGSISFRFDEIEDRICCIGVPAGVATGHIEMWLTNRLGFKFLESAHDARPAADKKASQEEDKSELASMVDYGNAVQQARNETQKNISRGDAKSKAPVRQSTWLIRTIQVQRQDGLINLILIGEDDAVGCSLNGQQFLRVVDMLENAFSKAQWPVPNQSYSNLGSKLAEASGQRLN